LPLPPASHVAVVACMDARAAQSRLVAATIRVVLGLRTWTSACRDRDALRSRRHRHVAPGPLTSSLQPRRGPGRSGSTPL
jgi:hypothetical protein